MCFYALAVSFVKEVGFLWLCFFFVGVYLGRLDCFWRVESLHLVQMPKISGR
jgi:uncharacterized membrane protein